MRVNWLDAGVIVGMVIGTISILKGYAVVPAIIIGGGITYLVAKYYYVRAGNELRNEAERLRNRSDAILRFLDHVFEDAVLQEDEDGEPVVSLIIKPEPIQALAGVRQPDVVSIVNTEPIEVNVGVVDPEVVEGDEESGK